MTTMPDATENAGVIFQQLMERPDLAANVTAFRGNGQPGSAGHEITFHVKGGKAVAAAWLEHLGPAAVEHAVTQNEVDGEVRSLSTRETIVHVYTGVES